MLKRWMARFRSRVEPGTKELAKINKQIQQIEKKIEELSNNGMENHITIEELNLDHPVLERLTFQLDKLELEEVSGALNLGNNFGVRVQQKSKSKKKSKKQQKEQQEHQESQAPPEKDPPGVKQTENGFRFRFEE